MSVVAFDTLEFAEILEKSGFSPQQAKSLIELQKRTLNEALESQIATKKDVSSLKDDLHKIDLKFTVIEGKVTLIHWMLGFNLAFSMAILYKLLFN